MRLYLDLEDFFFLKLIATCIYLCCNTLWIFIYIFFVPEVILISGSNLLTFFLFVLDYLFVPNLLCGGFVVFNQLSGFFSRLCKISWLKVRLLSSCLYHLQDRELFSTKCQPGFYLALFSKVLSLRTIPIFSRFFQFFQHFSHFFTFFSRFFISRQLLIWFGSH